MAANISDMNEDAESTNVPLKEDGEYRTKTPEKKPILLVVICVLLAVALIFFICTIALAVERNKTDEAETCLSEQCIKSAAMYLNSVDNDVNPCDNFYNYACGGWMRKRLVPEDRKHYTQLTLLGDDLKIKLKEILEREPHDSEPGTYEQIRHFYSSCMDEETINKEREQPLIQMLDSVGGWPVLGDRPGGNWNPSTFTFESLWVTLAKKFDMLAIISVWVGVDEKESSEHVLKINQPNFIVPEYEMRREHRDPVVSLLEDDPFPEDFGQKILLGEGKEYSKARSAYLQYMVDILLVLGVNDSVANEEMTKVMEFETELEKHKISAMEMRDLNLSYNPTTLEGLGQLYPSIDWAEMILNIIPPSIFPPVTMSERIIVKAPNYLRNITDILKQVSDDKVVANYMIWQQVSKVVTDLGQPFIDIRHKFVSAVRGISAVTARWKRCVAEANGVLPLVTGRMFVDKFFHGNAKEKTLEMVASLMTAFKSMLNDNDWLQEADKVEAIAKANNIKIEIGFPDWTKDNAQLDKKYDGLMFQNNSYFNNSLKFYSWTGQDDLSWLRKPVQRVWEGGAANANAFFSPSRNSIEFPAGILQPPFYHQDLPWYANYGGIGVVIGHEITHGFDNNGRKQDKDGNVRQWWSQKSIDSFEERAQCIAEQYSAFQMPQNGRHLNGNMTLGENIADNGGLKEAFKAFKNNVDKEMKLPGLDLTEDQMFFMTFGHVFCSLYNAKGVDSAINYGQHSPGRYRVIGSLQNNEEFIAAYNCPPNSYMNPTKKCSVW
ncbi:neprilysin-4-like [Asterias rubens]|uniref:neprilysin-4-like n=1 Tax=Asterias rubens TaxID=7604 RepID=UPI0014557087|nr:neprilysin-4-like [Asterias rubens]